MTPAKAKTWRSIKEAIKVLDRAKAELQLQLKEILPDLKEDMLTKATAMRPIRYGQMEFVVSDCGNRADRYFSPPWYVVHASGGVWDDRGWYLWHNYQGPPEVFLTHAGAQQRAKEFREQFTDSVGKVAIHKLIPIINQ